ncbi:hypothetical protein [Deinococcus aquaticus]|uniref:hypothetical protein n=1 Tax=Deinococcus aquaticus TaxID=328692 RepID=UPI0036175607
MRGSALEGGGQLAKAVLVGSGSVGGDALGRGAQIREQRGGAFEVTAFQRGFQAGEVLDDGLGAGNAVQRLVPVVTLATAALAGTP